MTDRNASLTSLVLMLKAPERSKRRIAARLGDAAAAEAARHLAACALEDLAAWPGPTWLAPEEHADLGWLGDAGAAHGVVLQGEGNLGARIEHVAKELRANGAGRHIFVGIDCPALDDAYLRRAADALAEHDVVLGSATDGGVVLMGTRGEWPSLEPLPWSTSMLGAALERACRSGGSSVAALDPRPDIDTFEDLAALGAVLARDERAARRALGAWVERIAAGIERTA